ncbi:MAG: transcriptional regulator [Anaerolineaceae bacterium]|nr:transcriptional regulator [Anaerolineaceae bacterium]
MKDALSAGLVLLESGEYRLTSDGRAAGRDVVRRHRLAERLLRDVLAAGGEHMEEAACRFEHTLLNGLDDKICTLLGHPTSCPHGKSIPEGDCCRKARADHIAEVTPLCDGKPGLKGIVAYLSTRDNREVQKMMAMGVLPGTDIELIRRFPSYVFQLGYSQFTVDKQLAEIIYVHWKEPNFSAGGSGSGEHSS